jgi:transcriptional regulator with XRE-family HTH domain
VDDRIGKRIGILLQRAREDAGLEQSAAAERLHVHPGTLSRYETGARVPSWGFIKSAAHLYRVPEASFAEAAGGGQATTVGGVATNGQQRMAPSDHATRTDEVRVRVREALRQGVSLAQLARASGLSDEAIRKIAREGSTRAARVDTIERLERGLEVVATRGRIGSPDGAAGGGILQGRLLAVLEFLDAATHNVRLVVDSGALLAGNASAPATRTGADDTYGGRDRDVIAASEGREPPPATGDARRPSASPSPSPAARPARRRRSGTDD